MTMQQLTHADLVLSALLGDELETAAFPYPPRVPFIGEHAKALVAAATVEILAATMRPTAVAA